MIKKTFTIFAALYCLAACNMGNASGYVPTKAEIAAIVVNVDTKETVTAKFGPPAVVGMDENNWYYVASYTEHPYLMPSRETERRILEIRFSGHDKVIALKEYGLADGKNIPLANDVTQTGGRELTLWQQLYGNIGNFSAESFLGQLAE